MLETSPELPIEPLPINDLHVFFLVAVLLLVTTSGAVYMRESGRYFRRTLLIFFSAVATFFLFFNCVEPYEKANRAFTLFLILIEVFNVEGAASLAFYVLRIAGNLAMFFVNVKHAEHIEERLTVVLALCSAFLMYYMNSSPSLTHKVLLIVVNATTVMELVSMCFLDQSNALCAVLTEINCCIYSFNDKRRWVSLTWIYAFLYVGTCVLRAWTQYNDSGP